MCDSGTIVPKNLVPFDNKGTCFYKKKKKKKKKKNGTKWSFSVKVEPFVPRSESRAEQFSPLGGGIKFQRDGF